jgi:hypothetical protein
MDYGKDLLGAIENIYAMLIQVNQIAVLFSVAESLSKVFESMIEGRNCVCCQIKPCFQQTNAYHRRQR